MSAEGSDDLTARNLQPSGAPAERRQKALVWLLAAVTVVLVGWALRAMSSVLVPIVFALFVALVVAPVDAWVKRRMPAKLKWVGHVAAMTVVLVVLSLFFGATWTASQRVVSELPAFSEDVRDIIPESMRSGAVDEGLETVADGNAGEEETDRENEGSEENGGEAGDGALSLGDGLTGAVGSLASTAADRLSGLGTTIITSAGTALSALVLIFFFALLMLIEAPKWRDKLVTIMKKKGQHQTFEATETIAGLLRRYLLARAILGLLTAVLYVAWLWIFGVDMLIVWGLLTFLLNFVPTLGSIISGILPVIYAFFTKDFQTAVFVGLGLLVIEQVMGNFIDPRVQGKQLSISPLVVLIVLLLWGWIWGTPGLLLAVPMTIAIVVTCAHVRPLRPLALLLSDERDMEGLDRMAKR